MKRRYRILAWSVLILTWACGPVRAEVANQVLAVVGDNVITMLDLEKLVGPTVEKLKAENRDGKTEERIASLRSQALEQMIVEYLTAAEAKRLGIKVRKSDIDNGVRRILKINKITRDDLIRTLAKDGITIDDYREQIRRQILQARLVYSTVKAKIVITEKQKREIYESRQSKYQTLREIELRRIVLPRDRRDLVEEVEKKLAAGADFAELAKELSQGPEAKDGGLLGFFKVEQLSREIREAVKGLDKGQVSRPVETKEGLQVFMISGIKVKEGKTYEEVEPIIAEELLQKELDKKFRELIQEVRHRSYIKIIPVRMN